MSSATLSPPETARATSPITTGLGRLFEPIDIGLIAFFRVGFGVVMLIEVWRYFRFGWIKSAFIDPPFHFTFYGFSWVQPWPGNGMYFHFAALGVLALMITVGFCYRAAATLFFFGITYVFLLEQALYLNHVYLICLISFLAIFLPANRKWSLDCRFRPQLKSETAPAWTLWVLRFQVGVAYFYGGLAKLDADWFSGRAVEQMISHRTDFPILGPHVGEPWVIGLFTWGGLLFDLAIVPLLLWNRTRTPAFVAAILFHSMNARMFQIGIFPLFMIVATLLFFPADSLKREAKDEKKAKGKKRREPKPAPVTPVVLGAARVDRNRRAGGVWDVPVAHAAAASPVSRQRQLDRRRPPVRLAHEAARQELGDCVRCEGCRW